MALKMRSRIEFCKSGNVCQRYRIHPKPNISWYITFSRKVTTLVLYYICISFVGPRIPNMDRLELIGTPPVDILHQPDCTWLCCLLCQYFKTKDSPNFQLENGFDLCELVFSKRPDPVLYIRKDGPVGPILSYIRFLCCQAL